MYWLVVSNTFLFSTLLGEMMGKRSILANDFQMGWFNHELDLYSCRHVSWARPWGLWHRCLAVKTKRRHRTCKGHLVLLSHVPNPNCAWKIGGVEPTHPKRSSQLPGTSKLFILPKTNGKFAPEDRPRAPKGKYSFPAVNLQAPTVSLKKCRNYTLNLKWKKTCRKHYPKEPLTGASDGSRVQVANWHHPFRSD